jgi:hybrid cluster-associated redox disulfide protein
MLELSTSIDDALTRYPHLASLFMRHHMICVGCDIARFHTVEEAAQMYEMDPVELLYEMRTAIETQSSESSESDAGDTK